MNVPGDRLRVMAARLCSVRTMERLIDPVLTDLQIEYRYAIAQGSVWRSRWIRVTGYVAFLKVIVLYGCERAVRDWSGDDGQAFARTAGLSAAAMAVAVLLLISPPLVREFPTNLLYLIPQALPLAIPVGTTVGVLCGLGGRVVSFRVKAAALAMAFGCSFGSLATMAWIVPAAAQASRVSIAEHVRRANGKEATQTMGHVEMTLSELRRTIDSLTNSRRTRDARRAAFAYQLRWALPLAPFALALFALSVMPRWRVRRWILGAAAFGSCLTYYLFLLVGDLGARQGMLPTAAAVWIPNLIFAVASAALLMVGAHRSRHLRINRSS